MLRLVTNMSDSKTSFRIEHDTFGDIEVADDKLWGAQTQRALHHFAISSERMPPELILGADARQALRQRWSIRNSA